MLVKNHSAAQSVTRSLPVLIIWNNMKRFMLVKKHSALQTLLLKNTHRHPHTHCSNWNFSAKVNILANEGPILHQDALSFHLSYQPPLYVSIHFLLHELVQLVLILLCKIKSTPTQVVAGSNESLEYADEDLDTQLQKYSHLQKIFKKSSVNNNKNIAWYLCTCSLKRSSLTESSPVETNNVQMLLRAQILRFYNTRSRTYLVKIWGSTQNPRFL